MGEFDMPLTSEEVIKITLDWKKIREEWVDNNPEWEEHEDLSPEELKNENKLGW